MQDLGCFTIRYRLHTTASEDSAGDLHRYDDRYFLDPKTLRKERETSENISKEFKEEKMHDAGASKVDDERVSKKSRIE